MLYVTASLPAYLLLATGGAYYPESPETGIFVFAFIIILAISGWVLIPAEKLKRSVFLPQIAVLFLLFMTLASASLSSAEPNYAFYKIENALTPSAFVSLLFLTRSSKIEQLLAGFVYIAFAILIVTILYKLNYGFMNRSVRFFINGPIVFGWMMAIALIFCVSNSSINRISKIILSICFFMAIFWTESKGPIIACVVALMIFGYQRSLIKTFLFAPIIVLVVIYILSELGMLGRAETVVRIVTGSLSDSDTGSVIIRQRMIERTLDLILAHPLWGVGLGNWSAHITIPHPHGIMMYPHNLVLELLAETGILRGSVIIAALLVIATRSSKRFLPVIALTCIAALFSGDLSYCRFILVSIMLGCIDAASSRKN